MDDEFDWSGFEQTRDASEPPEWLAGDDDDEPVAGMSILRAMAEDPANEIVELKPGVWWQPKQRGEMPSDRKLS